MYHTTSVLGMISCPKAMKHAHISLLTRSLTHSIQCKSIVSVEAVGFVRYLSKKAAPCPFYFKPECGYWFLRSTLIHRKCSWAYLTSELKLNIWTAPNLFAFFVGVKWTYGAYKHTHTRIYTCSKHTGRRQKP